MAWKKTISNIKRFFIYTKSEKNGTIVLAIILIALVTITFFLNPLLTSNSNIDNDTHQKVDSFFRSLEYTEPVNREPNDHSALKEELSFIKEIKQFYFDPNTVNMDSLVDLGLSHKQAQVVINYRTKGGRFKTANDLSKIHVIDSATFLRLKPWVRISENYLIADSTKANVPVQAILVELNSADSISLTKIKGIGRSFARRIILYRNLLGGFYSINQLSEVYGLNNELISTIRPNIWIDSLAVKRININMVTYEELKNHPYLTDYQAKSIVYYRSKRGSFVSLTEILESKL
ncbi:MAG: helix-hairpin-helix domain-containing protein, partial [Bacteroidales bacterium]